MNSKQNTMKNHQWLTWKADSNSKTTLRGTFDPKVRSTAYNSGHEINCNCTALCASSKKARPTAYKTGDLKWSRCDNIQEVRKSGGMLRKIWRPLLEYQTWHFKYWIALLDAPWRSSTGWKGEGLTSVLCRKQETRWKSNGVSLTGSYKLFWNGQKTVQNGVGIFIRESLAQNVLEVVRISSRLMLINLRTEKQVLTAYAPQTDESEDAKNDFWNTLSDAVKKTPSSEIPLIFNGRVGDKGNGFHGVMEALATSLKTKTL
ncbi:hypothetical protein HELRODRAFT_173140 [Helobdella robusta]|uniref:Uncharacterized protein n=1 Tax=Helobdella robusta TaxID=6412 RepID=T1F6F9_HELRO|nr:hypothetical protein HELRODRAFT_173140 [Helobdella robusta]ESO04066.1 hypothetical protein HELRODRAFT_173140 [Helobdella robusta]